MWVCRTSCARNSSKNWRSVPPVFGLEVPNELSPIEDVLQFQDDSFFFWLRLLVPPQNSFAPVPSSPLQPFLRPVVLLAAYFGPLRQPSNSYSPLPTLQCALARPHSLPHTIYSPRPFAPPNLSSLLLFPPSLSTPLRSLSSTPYSPFPWLLFLSIPFFGSPLCLPSRPPSLHFSPPPTFLDRSSSSHFPSLSHLEAIYFLLISLLLFLFLRL